MKIHIEKLQRDAQRRRRLARHGAMLLGLACAWPITGSWARSSSQGAPELLSQLAASSPPVTARNLWADVESYESQASASSAEASDAEAVQLATERADSTHAAAANSESSDASPASDETLDEFEDAAELTGELMPTALEAVELEAVEHDAPEAEDSEPAERPEYAKNHAEFRRRLVHAMGFRIVGSEMVVAKKPPAELVAVDAEPLDAEPADADLEYAEPQSAGTSSADETELADDGLTDEAPANEVLADEEAADTAQNAKTQADKKLSDNKVTEPRELAEPISSGELRYPAGVARQFATPPAAIPIELRTGNVEPLAEVEPPEEMESLTEAETLEEGETLAEGEPVDEAESLAEAAPPVEAASEQPAPRPAVSPGSVGITFLPSPESAEATSSSRLPAKNPVRWNLSDDSMAASRTGQHGKRPKPVIVPVDEPAETPLETLVPQRAPLVSRRNVNAANRPAPVKITDDVEAPAESLVDAGSRAEQAPLASVLAEPSRAEPEMIELVPTEEVPLAEREPVEEIKQAPVIERAPASKLTEPPVIRMFVGRAEGSTEPTANRIEVAVTPQPQEATTPTTPGARRPRPQIVSVDGPETSDPLDTLTVRRGAPADVRPIEPRPAAPIVDARRATEPAVAEPQRAATLAQPTVRPPVSSTAPAESSASTSRRIKVPVPPANLEPAKRQPQSLEVARRPERAAAPAPAAAPTPAPRESTRRTASQVAQPQAMEDKPSDDVMRIVVPPSKNKPSSAAPTPAPTPATRQDISQTAGSVSREQGQESIALAAHQQLDVGLRKASPLRLDSEVERVEVLDESICEVIQFSASELSVIGKREGKTQVRVWLKGQSSQEVVGYQVCVGTPEDAPSTSQEYAKLRESIAELYPDASIDMRESAGKLYVRGTVANKEQAVGILSLIRRVRLIPVVDQLEVYSR